MAILMLRVKFRKSGKNRVGAGIDKALSHKYIRRWPNPTGKGWRYLYPSDFLRPLLALKSLFRVKEEELNKTYESNNIKKDYGADKKTFAAHVLEYFSNKVEWDTFFANKENREKNKKPRKMGSSDKKPSGAGKKSGEAGSPADGSGNGREDVEKKGKETYIFNRSLIRKVWGIFNKQEERADERADRQDSPGTGQGALSDGAPAVRTGGSEERGDQHGFGAVFGEADNGGSSLQLSLEFGERSGRDVRLTKKETVNIREACLALLNSKTDDEMTEADKDLLRQYEGAGGLGEADATTHGTLYEFYTPRNVTKKVWQLVDKYIPSGKSVLEPSAGIGRFAEDRPNDRFTLNEFDPISSRISGILHPESENKHGAFQEFFKPGKNYTGKKYDVVIGNPPYGKYEGIHKGKGEGKDHTRYEEYFIDRGLDTLREGGIMAYVVPSSFLRNGDSKIKQKIAEKGKLMEAWRLPNGTFNTTGVGTDVIIIRKEQGDPAQFSNNAFFTENPDMVMGEETTRMGRFGEEKYCALSQGETFDETIDRINSGKIEVAPLGVPTGKEALQEKVKVKESEAAAHRNRSQAMMGNDNAKKDGLSGKEIWVYNPWGRVKMLTEAQAEETIKEREQTIRELERLPKAKQIGSTTWKVLQEDKDIVRKLRSNLEEARKQSGGENTGSEKPTAEKERGKAGNTDTPLANIETDTIDTFNKKYNKHIAPESLPVWKVTQWDGSIDIASLDDKSRAYIEKSGNYVKTADGRWFDIVNFASGNIYSKLDALEKDRGILSKAEYRRQKSILEKVLPKPKTVMDFELSPLSSISDDFLTSETRYGGDGELSLNESFKRWVRETPRDQLALPPDAMPSDILKYVNKERVTAARGSTDAQKEVNRLEAQRKITARREAAERLFNQYIREQLSLDDQKRLAETYNRQYNGTVAADITKIPVFLDGISKKFKGEDFTANESQMKGVSWLANQGNGIVAFDVGVGKYLENDEPVLTPDGWKRNGDLEEGDMVIAVDGTSTKILKVFPHKDKPIYRMTFSDGTYSLCGDEHLWEVQRANERCKCPDKWRVLSTLEIKADMDKTRRHRQWSIPMCDPVQFPQKTLKIKPYLMGALIGNGGMAHRAVMFTTADNFTLDKVKSLLPESVYMNHVENYDYRITSVSPQNGNDITKALREYGMMGHHSFDKFIPDDYLFSSIEDRIELLHGLMDTDGTVGGANGGTPIYYTTSAELAEDVKKLVQSLGGTAKINKKQGKYKKDGEIVVCRMCYAVTIRLKGINPFSVPHKAERYREHSKYFPIRFIDSIEFYKNADATCILVDHPRHLYITRDYIVTHNTVTAIMGAMNDIQMGRAKKPIIAVPKAVYKNWIVEIKELFPNVKINQLGNFGEISKFKNENGGLEIEDGSISLCTYEALNKIGFKDETLSDDLAESFVEALGTEEARKKSKRDSDKEKEGIMTLVGKASRTGDNWVNWEDTGFDHITVDEAHHFRNLFSRPKNVHDGDADEFKDVPNGSTALRSLKLYAITQMIQKKNNGRNVHLMTATPFQNSPVEIYNMLSYVAREQLKQAGIVNFHEFLSQFAELKPELAADSKNNIIQKNVMKGFKNLPALQGLINQYIMKIDGPDAGIVRPARMDHVVELNPTAEQRDIMEKIRSYMEAEPDSEADPGATLRCINALRQAALSPALVDGFQFLDSSAKGMAGIHEESIKVENKDFVTSSPKLSFICDATAKLYKAHPKEGQIIHIPQGVKHYGEVKKYLVSKGVPADTIIFMAPDYLKAGEAGIEQKEELTKFFNDPENKAKIIIGSDTMTEGVNLNGNTIATYEAMLGWNTTQTDQLNGRAQRQGNRQGLVHMTFPLMNDSVDSFMYQKHDEKGSRLDTIWKSKKTKIDLGDIDPEELKFSLIKDPKKRADLYIKNKTADLTQKQKIAEGISNKIFTMSGDHRNFAKEVEDCQTDIGKMKQALSDFNAKSDDEIIKEHDIDFSSSWKRSVYDDFVSVYGDNMKELRQNYANAMKERIANTQKTAQRNKGKMETIDNTLKRYGIDDADNMATVERIQKRYSEEALGYKAQIEAIERNRGQYIMEAAAQIKKESVSGVSVDEAVARNVKSVSENLFSKKETEKWDDAERERRGVKKSFVVFLRKRIKVHVRKMENRE
jgi:hypothetical protein